MGYLGLKKKKRRVVVSCRVRSVQCMESEEGAEVVLVGHASCNENEANNTVTGTSTRRPKPTPKRFVKSTNASGASSPPAPSASPSSSPTASSCTPGIKAFRYDPYMGKLFLEEYDHVGMKQSRKGAIFKARDLGTLGRQGNPKILERLEKKVKDKGFKFSYTVVLMSEISPGRIALFEDSVDAWIQIACPRLSIDWGDAFVKPVLTPFEAEIALGLIRGWWDKTQGCEDDCIGCKKSDSCSCGDAKGASDFGGDYPMDYYAQDGGEWNSSYVNKSSRPARRISVSCVANSAISKQS